MIYKADALKREAEGFIQSNERIAYKIVHNINEEHEAKSQGWVNHPNDAELKLQKIDRNKRLKNFLISNWKFWITTIITLLAIYIAYLGIQR